MPVKAIRVNAAGQARRLWLSLALALGLTGCELLQQIIPEEPAPPTTSSAPPPEDSQAEDSQAAVVVTKPAAKPKPVVAAVPPAVPPAPTKPSLEPQALIGLGEEEITRLLGEPRDVRNDPPAMVWNFAAGECRLDLFFYLDLKSQDFRALSYNFDPNATSDGAKKACLEKIQEANRDRRR